MSHLPEILQRQTECDCVTLLLHVSPDLAYFRGHFPGLPILPGVVQVDWAIKLASQSFTLPLSDFRDLKALKFSAPVQPDTQLKLTLRWNPETGRLDFTYANGERRVGSGQAVFGVKDTQ